MSDELISTALFDDPDPEGTDKYGMLPLIMEMPDENDDDSRDDRSGSDRRGKGGGDGEEEGGGGDEALVEPSSIDVEVPAGVELPDEDDSAYSALTAPGASDLSPGEAENLINYMRPMSEEEQAFYEEDPLNRDVERVDDPAHTDDVLRAGKGDHGVDKYLNDASYGDDMSDPDERAELGDSDVTVGYGNPFIPRGQATWSNRDEGRRYGGRGSGDQGDGHRRKHRHHRRHRDGQPPQPGQPGYGLQPGQPGYGAPLPGQPGYGLLPGQPGYGLQPGQPGYVAPPGQPGYVDAATAAFNAAHGITAPVVAATSYYPGTSIPVPQQYYPGTTTPVPATQYYPGTTTPIPTTQYYPGTTTPIPTTQYYPGTTTPIPSTLPYQQPAAVPTYTPGSSDPSSDASFILGRDHAKVKMVRGLGGKLAVEHANWLADQDQAAGIAVRPRSYYENVGKLWAMDKLKRAQLPTSTTVGNWTPSHKNFVTTADGLLGETAMVRKRFSSALGADVDLGGWSPWGAVKSAVRAVEHGAKKGASYGYKAAKFGVTAPFTYTYKGVKYVGKMAEKIALAPLRAIINRFTNTMVSRRANVIAKQKGLAAPTAVEKAAAKSWAKQLVRAKGGKFGGAIASLMGSDFSRQVDISLGEHDLMGVGTAGVAGLILLGPIGLIALLTGLVKLSGPAAPPPDPGSPDAAAEAAQAEQDAAAAQDAGTADGGSPGDGGSPADGSADDGSADDGSADADQSGYAQKNSRPSLTIEQLNRLPPGKRQRAQQLIRSGHIRLA